MYCGYVEWGVSAYDKYSNLMSEIMCAHLSLGYHCVVFPVMVSYPLLSVGYGSNLKWSPLNIGCNF